MRSEIFPNLTIHKHYLLSKYARKDVRILGAHTENAGVVVEKEQLAQAFHEAKIKQADNFVATTGVSSRIVLFMRTQRKVIHT